MNLNRPPVHIITFVFYLLFLANSFLHLGARIPGFGRARPTLLLIGILSLLLLAESSKLRKRGMDIVSKSFLVFLVYLLISLPLVQYPGSVVRHHIPVVLNAIVFFIFTTAIVDKPSRMKITISVFVTLQVFRVLEPLYLNITTGYWGSATHMGGEDFLYRLSGAPYDIINPNELGFVIATVIPFLHFLLLPKGGIGRFLYFGLLPILLYALVLTMSRGAFLALTVVAVVIFKQSNKKILLIGIFIAVAAMGWNKMDSSQKDRYLSLVGKSQTANAASSTGRLMGIVNEVKLGMKRPLFGHGIGTTQEAKYIEYGGRLVSHSLYAELLIEIGMIGMVLFLRFLFVSYRQLRYNCSRQLGTRYQFFSNLKKALLTVFFMYLVYSINYWGLTQFYWYFFGGLVCSLRGQVDILDRFAFRNNPDEVIHGKT